MPTQPMLAAAADAAAGAEAVVAAGAEAAWPRPRRAVSDQRAQREPAGEREARRRAHACAFDLIASPPTHSFALLACCPVACRPSRATGSGRPCGPHHAPRSASTHCRRPGRQLKGFEGDRGKSRTVEQAGAWRGQAQSIRPARPPEARPAASRDIASRHASRRPLKSADDPSRPLAIRRFHAPGARPGPFQGRPHRHRHDERVRPPDALRPVRGLPAGDDEEGAPEVHHPRAAVVPARRLERQVAAGARLHDLGRMGARGRRPRPGLRRAMALVADARRRPHRPDRRGRQAAEDQPRLAPHHRQRLERGRPRRRWR